MSYKLRCVREGQITEYPLLESVPNPPYLIIKQGDIIGYLKLTNIGSGLNVNGHYIDIGTDDDSTSWIVILDDAQLSSRVPSNAECLDQIQVSYGSQSLDVSMEGTGSVLLTPLPRLDGDEIIVIDLSANSLDMIASESVELELITPIIHEATESMETSMLPDFSIEIVDGAELSI